MDLPEPLAPTRPMRPRPVDRDSPSKTVLPSGQAKAGSEQATETSVVTGRGMVFSRSRKCCGKGFVCEHHKTRAGQKVKRSCGAGDSSCTEGATTLSMRPGAVSCDGREPQMRNIYLIRRRQDASPLLAPGRLSTFIKG